MPDTSYGRPVEPPLSPDTLPADHEPVGFRALRVRARHSNLERVARLSEALSAAENGNLDRNGRDRAALIAHQVIGSAGTFGFPGATDAARRLQGIIGGGEFTTAQLAIARQLLTDIRAALAGEPSDQNRG